MRITKLKIGIYFHGQKPYPFCAYHIPTGNPADRSASSDGTFYRLRDLDVMFFHEQPGYIHQSGKIPSQYLSSLLHTVRDVSGDIFMSSIAIGEVAKKLGNYMLAEFCTLSREQLKNGIGDEMLRSVSGFQFRHPFMEVDEDLDSVRDSDRVLEMEMGNDPPKDRQTVQGVAIKRSPSPIGGQLETERGESGRDTNAKKVDSKHPPASATEPSERFKFPAPHEAALKRNRSQAELSESAQSEGQGDMSPNTAEEQQSGRPKQRKRLSINTAVGHNIPRSSSSASVDVMEQMRNTLKLKQQQQAIIEARHSAAQRGPMSAGVRGDSPPSSRRPSSPKHRNSKNLTIWTGEGAQGHRGGAMTAPADGPHGTSHPPSVLHPGRGHGSPSGASLLSPRHLNPAPGKSHKITQRGPEASRYNPMMHSANMPSAQTLMSPRGEFPSRELPLPPHLQPSHGTSSSDRDGPRSPLPPLTHSHSASKLHSHIPPQSPSSAYPPPTALPGLALSKTSFLSLFESLYDQAEENYRLQNTLRDQMRRSTAMLQTLTSSGQMIEGLVRTHFREMQVSYGEKFGSALAELNRRVERLEEMNGISREGHVGSSSAQWGFRGGPPSANVNGSIFWEGKGGDKGADVMMKGMLERLEKLEKSAEKEREREK